MAAISDHGYDSTHEKLEQKLVDFLKSVLRLGDDVSLEATANLIDEIGLDSIEAFDAVATLHEIMNRSIPDDFDPKVVGSVRSLSQYLAANYPADALQAVIQVDLAALREQWDMAE